MKDRFFEKTFLVADTSMEMVLGMLFFSLSNIVVDFSETRGLTWRSYTTPEALLITNRVQLIDKYKFSRTALDENAETFVVQVIALKASEMAIYSSQARQIPSAHLAAL